MEKIKILELEYEIVSIMENKNLLSIEFKLEMDFTGLDTSIIELYTNGGIKCREFIGFSTIYKQSGTEIIFSNDGSVYVEPIIPEPVPEPEPYVPTEEELAEQSRQLKISELISKINELKLQLEATDYQVIKGYEYFLAGETCAEYDYLELHKQKEELRTQITVLEEELKTL